MRNLLPVLTASCLITSVQADEGMWTYDNFPAAAVREKLGVDITTAWLDRVRLNTVRLANCTASFVSGRGLILTNNHCIEACLAENSSKQRSLVEDGFLARKGEEEIRCASQIADVLVEMQDITAELAKVTAGVADAAANEARKRRQTELEQDCEKRSGKRGKAAPLKCETVTLYNGGQYFLYKYRRYSDVRLVFALETAIGAFGGDPDNFQFPRWSLDMGLLRAYENGKPVSVTNPLHIDFNGPAAGSPVFVSGHPGSTDRQLTIAELKLMRDVDLPRGLQRASELRGRYIQFSNGGAEQRRITQEPLNTLENGIKVRRKLLDALHEDGLLAQKQAEADTLRSKVAARPDLAAGFGDPWGDIAKATEQARALNNEMTFLEFQAGFNSRLLRQARTLVRAAEERKKPNTERLREFTDASLPLIEQTLAANVPVYPEMERLTLAFGLERMREWLGPDHPVVRDLLVKDSPNSLAERLVAGTTLADPAVRVALFKGGAAAVESSTDPMIVLARSVDARARAVRKQYEDEVEAPTRTASERIARARFALFGTAVYPDATFTLRLNYGTVQGWNENGKPVEPFTRLAGVFSRATDQAPFRVPDSWTKVRDTLDMSTPFCISTNNDIVGGNSGSPLLNARGDIVGLLFDGNIHSISGSYWFDTAKNRSIAVHPAIMREALGKVYRATEVLKELEAR